MPAVALGPRIRSLTFGAGSAQALPLGAPRNLRATEMMGTPGSVRFNWSPPLSWGAAGPHATDRYQYEFRLESSSSGNLNPWSGVLTNHNSEMVTLPWAAAHSHPPNRIQFRVRSRDADGNTSGWLESEVLTEGEVNPRRAFSRGFSRGFA